MSPYRTLAIFRKEVKQLMRDKKLLFVLFFFPVFLLIIFGYAVNYDVKNITIAVYDESKSAESRGFIEGITQSEYFTLTKYLASREEINKALDKGEVQAVIVFGKDFSKKFLSGGKSPKIQVLIDGLNGNTAGIIQNYLNLAAYNYANKYQNEFLLRVGKKNYIPVELENRFLFNPELETTKFLIPGLIGFILIITAIISVSLSFVREKELGTIEQLNVSSIKIFELVVGKAMPFLLISLINAVFILIAGYILFGVTVNGSYFLLLITTLIFLVSSISVGIFFSIIADTQQVAFSAATFFSLLPSLILSGFVFPIDSMPYLVRLLTNITPVKFYLVALRAIIIRGVGLEAFWQQWIYLLLFGLFFTLLTIVIGRKQMSAV